jgi:RNA polymerase-binding transcription factor DksA
MGFALLVNFPLLAAFPARGALEAIENSEIHEIHQIQEALKRISEGTYGICARCGEDILTPNV